MLPEYLQFLAFYVLTIALLKILASWAQHNNWPTAASGLGWFVPGLA